MPRNPFRRTRVAKGADLAALAATTGAPRTAVATPQPIADAMTAQGMDTTAQLGPGRPQNPSWGYSTPPRAMDYPTGVNIQTGDSRASWGRTSFNTLRELIDAYDIARMCINHKIDELRSMEVLFQPADGFNGDADQAIDIARLALEFPDGDPDHPFDTWLGMWLEDCLRYDAGTLHRARNYNGQVIGLEVIDGTTLAPKIDQYGRKPRPPAPAWQQIIKGLPTKDYTTDDIVRTTFRAQPNSPFGLAPMESVLLTVNTDIRYQLHFLELFTEGTVPAGLLELPEGQSSPDQVAEFQDFWDAMMAGDQAMLRRIRMVPNGAKLNETRPQAFDRTFPEWLAVRTCAAFGVVPQDLGLTMDVNRANGETQTDLQFRVNTLPWVLFVEGVLTRYLKRDLGLPVQVKLNTGRDKEDRLQEAQTWAVLVQNAIASADEARTELTGLPVDNERPVPRGFLSPRTGFVPLRSIEAISGPTDPETGAPVDSQPLDTTPFDGAGGVLPDKSPGGTQFKRAPIDPDDPQHPELEHVVPGSDVIGTTPSTKPVITDPSQGAQVEAVQATANPLTVATDKVDAEDVAKEATAGVTSGTGLTGSPLAGSKPVSVVPDDDDDEGDEDDEGTEVAKAAELAAFRRFVKARAKAGRWRDFAFTVTDEATGHALNQHARARIRKATGQVVAAGLAVVAADTGRVLMLQRALNPGDPNGGTWEFPGGCLDDGESAPDAAVREWQEETGCQLPAGRSAGGWTSRNGLYEGLVWVVPSEAEVSIFDRAEGWNPDDPDGDATEALAWWDAGQLAGNPAVRPELAADLDVVLDAIAGDAVKEATPGKAPDPVAKSWRDGAAKVPQHEVDLRLTDYWSPKIRAALLALVSDAQIRAAIAAVVDLVPPKVAKSVADDSDTVRQQIAAQVAQQLTGGMDSSQLDAVIRQVYADSCGIGGMAASRQLGISVPGWDTWQPGDDLASALTADGGLAELLSDAGVGVKGIAGSALDALGNQIADGLMSGLDVDSLAGSLSDWVTGARAEMVTHTESARAVTAATLATYQVNDIGEWDLVLSDGACPECEAVAEGGPYPASDSGDAPPIHPRCRCSASPHIPADWTAPAADETTTDDSGD